jgi:predicted NACHT family NTPase
LSIKALKLVLQSKALEMDEPLNWSVSIMDLMKLLGQDWRERHLIQLALKLGFMGDVRDSYTVHVWLHNRLMTILAKNGGTLPVELRE